MTIGVLLMAAGRSRRFKQASNGQHKLLFPCDKNGTPMLQKTYQTVTKIFDPNDVCIIVNQAEDKIQALATQLNHNVLSIHSNGMGESIAKAVKAHQHWDGLLILHADLPMIKASTIQHIKNSLVRNDITRPIYRDQPGHPVGFSKKLYPELMALKGDQGAAPILKSYTVRLIPIDDSGAITDIDQPQDLEGIHSL